MWLDEMNVFEQYVIAVTGTVFFGMSQCLTTIDDMLGMMLILSAMGLFFGLAYRIINTIKPKEDEPVQTAPIQRQIFNFDSAIAEGKIVPYLSGSKTVYQINLEDFQMDQFAFILALHKTEIVQGIMVHDQTTSHIYIQYLFVTQDEQQFVLRIFIKQRPLLRLVG
jgi:hypothetical protein